MSPEKCAYEVSEVPRGRLLSAGAQGSLLIDSFGSRVRRQQRSILHMF